MSLIIIGKGDEQRLSLFKQGDFEGYELYLGLFDKRSKESILKKLSPPLKYIKISSIHNPTKVKIGEEIFPFNLSDEGILGDKSLIALKETIDIAKILRAKIIVIHGATFNYLIEKKESAIKRLADKVFPLFQEGITFTFETDALWHNLFYPKRALLTSEEDFKLLNNFLNGKLKITADIEHLYLTFYFNKFIEHLGGEKKFLVSYGERERNKFEKDVVFFIKNNFLALNEEAKRNLISFFKRFKDKIEHIHLNGSDCFNFLFNKETGLPLIGEHLPLGFDRGGVTDRLDYLFLSNLFHILSNQKEINIVMEVWRKNPFDFIEDMRQSKQFLTKYLNRAEEKLL